MKKFLLLAFAILLVSPSFSEITIKSSNSNNLTISNIPVTSKQNEDKYTIRFLNDEGTEISSEQYEFGAMPEAPATTPEKENPSPLYTYTFSGWSPSIALVTEDIDYVATYKADAKVGDVVWVDGDGKTLLTEEYAYGSMPNYHGATPTKKATDTETYVFSGWNPTIETVSKPSITYEATFNPIPIPKTQYSIQINCTNCLVNKKRSINEKYNPLTDLIYQFNNISDEIYHYPYQLEVTVNGESTDDYTYDNLTGKLNIKLTGNTVISAVADNSCVLMKYEYSTDYPTVEITCEGAFEYVDWGDGTTIDKTNKSHTYSYSPDTDQYDIRVFGRLNNIGTTSKFVTSVNVFHSITSIGRYAFSDCSSLSSITIPNSVTSIGYSAFYYCSSLAFISIPNSVTSIGSYAFRDCSSLSSITIPNSVTSIGSYAFYYCSSLTINCEDESEPSGWSSDWNPSDRPVIWGYVENGEYNNFKYGVSLIGGNKSIVLIGLVDRSVTSITIPSTFDVGGENIPVTSIGNSAFYNCSSLSSITIPNSVTSIGNSAFYNCSSLSSITIPNSVTSIGNSTFYYCSSLAFISIPNSVTSIGNSAFYNCPSLSSITIPNSVTSIGSYAFYHCSSLTINCEDESKPSGWSSYWNDDDRPVIWGYVENGEYNNFKYGVSLIGGNKSIVLIGLVDRSVTSITIPSTFDVGGENIPVTSIGNSAFYNCSSLSSITIPNSVTSIGYRVFYHCSSLASISIPNSVTSIGNLAFYYCSSLTSITIPNSVTSIGISAFSDCSSLSSITIPNSVTSIGNSAFLYCSSLTSITIPNSVTSIGNSAFYNCSALSSITIPNSVTSIGSSAFYNCSSLETFDLSNLDHVIDINDIIFSSKYIPTIKVKSSMLDEYQSDYVWKRYKEKMVAVD